MGLFIPLPLHLAKKFPTLIPDDHSPSHVTLLYIGKVNGAKEQARLVDLLREVCSRWYWTEARASLGDINYFDHGDRVVPHLQVEFSKDFASFRRLLKQELTQAGFEPEDKHVEYRPHVTLDYLPSGEEWTGKLPKGSWNFDQIEIWGLPEQVPKIQLGRPKTASPRRLHLVLRMKRLARSMMAKDKDKDKDKDNKGDMIPLSKEDEKLLDKLWDEQGASFKKEGRAQRAEGEEVEEEPAKKPGKSSLFGSEAFKEFWDSKYEGGRKKVPNTNSATKDRYPQVSSSTRMRNDPGFRKKILEEFKKWKDEQGKSSKKPTSKAKPDLDKLGKLLKKDRFSSVQFGVDVDESVLKRHKITREDIADIAGLGSLASNLKLEGEIQIFQDPYSSDTDAIKVKFRGHGYAFDRTINLQEKTVKNDLLRVPESAPSGTGAKIFGSQVLSARAKGFKAIKCDALTNPPNWNGGLVWPKFGYDANLSKVYDENPLLLEEAETVLKKYGFKPPHKVSQLMMSDEGRKFWKENVPEWVWDMKFDLKRDSVSSKILDAYLEAKGYV